MDIVIRSYASRGAAALFNALEKRQAELLPIMGSVPGLVSYTLARSDAGGFSVTVCQDRAGIDESTRRARNWIAQNTSRIAADPPTVSFGEVIVHFQP